MNKRQLLQQAKRIVDSRRYAAEEQRERVLEQLRQNDEWRLAEQRLRSAQVDLAMGYGDATALKNTVAALEKQLSELLKKSGVKPSELTPRYSCKLCNDTGYVDGKMCNCLQTELRRLIIAGSNIPDKDFTFENSSETDKHNLAVYKKVKQICNLGDKNILLTGQVGTGKTYLLSAAANYAAQCGKSVLFVTAYSLNADFLAAYLDGQDSSSALLENLIDTDLLLIDDLGTERLVNNVTANFLFNVLNERMLARKQIFFTTNLQLKDIQDRYDERIVSRLLDQSRTFIAQLAGDDKRLAKNRPV